MADHRREARHAAGQLDPQPELPEVGRELDEAALIWSKAPVNVGAQDTRPLIRSKNGFWLAIPLSSAGKSLRGDRITPCEWERPRGARPRFLYPRTNSRQLVA